MLSDWLEVAGLIVSFVGSIWLVKALYRRGGGTTREGTLDVGDVAHLVADMRTDGTRGSVLLAIGFVFQVIAKLLSPR